MQLGERSPRELNEARLCSHWASQCVAAAGSTLLPERPDSSHTALTWSPRHGALMGEALTREMRAALRLADLSLIVVDVSEVIVAEVSLVGRTLDEALRWLGQSLRVERTLIRPAHELPDHAVGHGEPFRPTEPASLRELARWYEDAAHLLAALLPSLPGASPVRCWPHHFDIATLVSLDLPGASAGGDPEHARSVGIGMSPGDASYAEPYLYVTPWPYPKERPTPALAAGSWHVEGWYGAVLLGSTLCASTSQEQMARAFVQSAFEQARNLAMS